MDRKEREANIPHLTIKQLKAEIGALLLWQQMRLSNILELEAAAQSLKDRYAEDQIFLHQLEEALKENES